LKKIEIKTWKLRKMTTYLLLVEDHPYRLVEDRPYHLVEGHPCVEDLLLEGDKE
jgi:hypothetical protein